jgi:hypothetical protein
VYRRVKWRCNNDINPHQPSHPHTAAGLPMPSSFPFPLATCRTHGAACGRLPAAGWHFAASYRPTLFWFGNTTAIWGYRPLFLFPPPTRTLKQLTYIHEIEHGFYVTAYHPNVFLIRNLKEYFEKFPLLGGFVARKEDFKLCLCNLYLESREPNASVALKWMSPLYCK